MSIGALNDNQFCVDASLPEPVDSPIVRNVEAADAVRLFGYVAVFGATVIIQCESKNTPP